MDDLLRQVQFAVPVFHSYGHVVSCQVVTSFVCIYGEFDSKMLFIPFVFRCHGNNRDR